MRAHCARIDEIGDARGQHARLAAARAREDQRGLMGQGDRLSLFGIKAVENTHGKIKQGTKLAV